MSIYDKPDSQVDGQITIEQCLKPEERLIAVSRVFARARKEMTISEQKTFVYALSQLDFTKEAETEIVYLDKKRLAEIVGISNDTNNLSINLHRSIMELPKHSFIETSVKDKNFFDSGTVITRVTMLKNRVRVKFEKEYLPLFTGLTTDYITMWSADIFQMSSKRTVQFYEYLRQITDTRQGVNEVLLGVKAIKDMFNIPKDGKGSYMRKDGHFDRLAFEKGVIDSICTDMKHCRMINLLIQPDGKYYVKEKRGSRVEGYRFFWAFTSHPAVATATEVKDLQERVDKNPVVLKVAKDIASGKPKSEKEKQKKKRTDRRKGTEFNNLHEREYNYSSTESDLLKATMRDLGDLDN